MRIGNGIARIITSIINLRFSISLVRGGRRKSTNSHLPYILSLFNKIVATRYKLEGTLQTTYNEEISVLTRANLSRRIVRLVMTDIRRL